MEVMGQNMAGVQGTVQGGVLGLLPCVACPFALAFGIALKLSDSGHRGQGNTSHTSYHHPAPGTIRSFDGSDP